jgi:hypothetical protein
VARAATLVCSWMPNVRDIKEALQAQGLEVYLSKGEAVHIAERPRENLIMDSGVRLYTDLRVGFYARTEESRFPGEESSQLHQRIRSQLVHAEEQGFIEQRQFVTKIEAPGDATKVLDRWFEIFYERPTDSLQEAIRWVKTAIKFDKVAKR